MTEAEEWSDNSGSGPLAECQDQESQSLLTGRLCLSHVFICGVAFIIFMNVCIYGTFNSLGDEVGKSWSNMVGKVTRP